MIGRSAPNPWGLLACMQLGKCTHINTHFCVRTRKTSFVYFNVDEGGQNECKRAMSKRIKAEFLIFLPVSYGELIVHLGTISQNRLVFVVGSRETQRTHPAYVLLNYSSSYRIVSYHLVSLRFNKKMLSDFEIMPM